ncbi:hypothetical protein N8843_09960 [Verrucomicrobia bacterium]|nr:hypothetical protein [Verrucomicrobiota bacterium]
MQRRVHQYLIGLPLLVIVPVALPEILIAVKAGESGFSPTDFLAIMLCVVSIILDSWGGKLFFHLYVGFLPLMYAFGFSSTKT